MKKLLRPLLLLAAVAAFSAPGVIRQNVELFWTPNAPGENVTSYVLYSKPDLTSPWVVFVPLSGDKTNYFIYPTNAGRYFALTASNLWGESGFSPAVWVPQLPSSNGLFQVR